MGRAEYERIAADALDMPSPDGATAGDFLTVGTWCVGDQVDALDAITTRRAHKVRQVAAALSGQEFAHLADIATSRDFLSFPEYRNAIDRIDDIRKRLADIAESERRKAFDRENRTDKTYFYPTYERPPQTEITLARLFDSRTHTPDAAGYLAYVKTVHPPLSDLFFWRLPALIPERDRELHTYITGSSGAGKSEIMKVLIHAYVTKKKPPCIVVIDPHGKFADEVAKQREVVESGRLIYLNPAQSKHRTPTINPFECDEPERAEYIGKGLIGLFELLFMQENSAELSGNMRVLLNALIPALLRMDGTDILTLQKLLGADVDDKLFRQALGKMEPHQRDYIRTEWGQKSFESTKESLRKKIQTIASTPFLRFVCGKNTIDLGDAIKRRSIICLSLSKSDLDMGTIKAMGAFFLATLQAYVYAKAHERPETDRNRVPIHVFIDECHNFVSPTFKEILAEARKFGLHLTLAQQFAGQGMEDPDLKKGIMGNTGVKLAGFNNEKATQKAMAREMQLTEDDLIALPKRQFYVKSTDGKPFKLYPPSHLVGSRNCVDSETWYHVVGEQLERYYRRIEPPKATAPDDAPRNAERAPEPEKDVAEPVDFLDAPIPDFR